MHRKQLEANAPAHMRSALPESGCKDETGAGLLLLIGRNCSGRVLDQHAIPRHVALPRHQSVLGPGAQCAQVRCPPQVQATTTAGVCKDSGGNASAPDFEQSQT